MMKKFILTIAVFGFIALHVAAQGNIRLQFNQTGKFKIVQFTDLHWLHGSPNCAKTIATIRAVLETEKPDLAILTGDIVWRLPAREPWTDIPRIFEDAKTPFAVVLGNHDSEASTEISREEIFDILSRSPYFVGEKGPADIHGCGNYVVPIRGTNANIAALIYCLDSNDYSSDPRYGTYAPVFFDQIDWYRQQSDKYSAANDHKPLPALAFFHIPFPEYNNIIGKENTVGHISEHVSAPQYNTGLFGAFLEKGDVMGVFVGHDHSNDYIGVELGIALAYGRVSGADQGAKAEQGGRIIELHENKFAFDTWIRTPTVKELEFNFNK